MYVGVDTGACLLLSFLLFSEYKACEISNGQLVDSFHGFLYEWFGDVEIIEELYASIVDSASYRGNDGMRGWTFQRCAIKVSIHGLNMYFVCTS